MSDDFFCSWSGGKDSCLALYRAMQAGGKPKALLTMLTEDGERSRSHGLSTDLLRRQAAALGLPLVLCSTAWDNYEQNFLAAISEFRDAGMTVGVFGDIDLEAHRAWAERVCAQAGIEAREPLWQAPRRKLLEEFLDLGFKTTIVAVKDGLLDPAFLGCALDAGIIARMEAAGIDASGEEGEYHSVVTDGPIFKVPIKLKHGPTRFDAGYIFLDVSVAEG